MVLHSGQPSILVASVLETCELAKVLFFSMLAGDCVTISLLER